MRGHRESVFARISHSPLFDFIPVEFDGRRTIDAHEMVMVGRATQSIQRFAIPVDGINCTLIGKALQGSVDGCQ